MRKFVIMGIQGSGKGTQAKLLADDFDLVHLSIGDIFRWNIQNHTKLGANVKRIVATGHLVDDELVERVMQERLALHDWNFGFIIDGFPRNVRQTEFFLESYDIDGVINLELPDSEVERRVLARRLCSGCGLDYNLIYRPKVEDVCDVCGAPLHRAGRRRGPGRARRPAGRVPREVPARDGPVPAQGVRRHDRCHPFHTPDPGRDPRPLRPERPGAVGSRSSPRCARRSAPSTQIVVAAFTIAVLVGTALLMLPVASESAPHPGFVNSLFTSTSAVTVTGLATVSIGEWSPFGEVVILLLIQVGDSA